MPMKSSFGVIFGLFFLGFVTSSFEGCDESYCDLKFSGKVMDEDGNPLVNMKVSAYEMDSLRVYHSDSINADSSYYSKELRLYFLGDATTGKDGKYEIAVNNYDYDKPRGEYRLKVLDDNNVYAPDSTDKLQWFKVSPGKRHDVYDGGYMTQYRFTLKKNQ